MSKSQRKHFRLTHDIPAIRYTTSGEKIAIVLYQISIGGGLIEWDEAIEIGEEFRLEIQLPNKNWLPLNCKPLYTKEGDGFGIQFFDITQFEQELIAEIMLMNLENEGIPMKFDPFSLPKTYSDENLVT